MQWAKDMLNRDELSAQSMKYAKQAGLKYILPSLLGKKAQSQGYRRVRRGKSFAYVDQWGRAIRDEETLARIRKLAIPPAYENVWIAADPKAHLQVIGQDARGRKQYRYHPKWLAIKDQTKYSRMLEFAHTLPGIRDATRSHLARKKLDREKVLATVVQLLEKTLIRIGNDEYAKSNHSYGLSTLHHEHVHIEDGKIIFHFNGKSKVHHKITLKDPRLAKIVGECRSIRGKELFQYHDEDGTIHRIHSQDVNGYIQTITGKAFTAKDFRTWGATLFAASVFEGTPAAESKTKLKQVINQVVDQVASKLGNTRSICRKSYIHPAVVEAFSESKPILKNPDHDLEKQVIHFLKQYHREKGHQIA